MGSREEMGPGWRGSGVGSNRDVGEAVEGRGDREVGGGPAAAAGTKGKSE